MFTRNLDQAVVLLVDDDSQLVGMVSELLHSDGMQVHAADSGRAALEMLESAVPDVLVLDVMLPDVNGLDLCRRLRGQGCVVPILMLTARGAPVDRVLGLELGADDYLGKPFDPRELVARIRALFRRARDFQSPGSLLRLGNLEIDQLGFRVLHAGVLVALTPSEIKLLAALARQPGQPMSRQDLSAAVQPTGYLPLDRAVDVQVARLRKKLAEASDGQEWITTVRGVGYVLTGQ